jgi:hypothetical protein
MLAASMSLFFLLVLEIVVWLMVSDFMAMSMVVRLSFNRRRAPTPVTVLYIIMLSLTSRVD